MEEESSSSLSATNQPQTDWPLSFSRQGIYPRWTSPAYLVSLEILLLPSTHLGKIKKACLNLCILMSLYSVNSIWHGYTNSFVPLMLYVNAKHTSMPLFSCLREYDHIKHIVFTTFGWFHPQPNYSTLAMTTIFVASLMLSIYARIDVRINSARWITNKIWQKELFLIDHWKFVIIIWKIHLSSLNWDQSTHLSVIYMKLLSTIQIQRSEIGTALMLPKGIQERGINNRNHTEREIANN